MAKQSQPKSATTYAFIDSQNLNLGVQRVGWKLDWRRFRQYLQDEHGVSKAYMFIGYMSENEALYEYMHELGFLVVLKPTIDVKTHDHHDAPTTETLAPKDADAKSDAKDKAKPEKERSMIKGNVDAELVLYAMKEIPNYKQAIIVSGDGDFFSLAEYLEEQGRLAHILTPNWQYSTLLKPFEDKIIRLDQLRRELSYHDRKSKNAKSAKRGSDSAA